MLKLDGVTKSFGGLTAVDHVSFVLDETGITGLVGPNGSGKTTLFHLITGFYKADRGRIYFHDRLLTGRSPYEISRLGLVRTFQQTRILPFLSVMDTLLSAPSNQTGERLLSVFMRPGIIKKEEQENRNRAGEVLELLRLAPLTNELASRLSFGQQKLLELGRVLMAQPEMILLDEPTAGINPTLIRQLIEVLFQLSGRGIRLFLIEHNMPLVSEICQKVLVMDSGNIIFSGTPSEARRNNAVIEAYLGRA